jgi:hypothetical protein
MMHISPAESLIKVFERNNDVIHMQAKDITQAESLLRLPSGGNCMNWVVGHILADRDVCLRFLGQPTLLSEEEFAIYDRGSDLLTDSEKASPMSQLLEKIALSCELLTTALRSLPKNGLETVVEFGSHPAELGKTIAFLQWHETYHIGQLELLRNLAGKHEHLI